MATGPQGREDAVEDRQPEGAHAAYAPYAPYAIARFAELEIGGKRKPSLETADMNAAEVLRTAKEAGVRFEVDAGDLVVEADREPEPWIFEAIRREKARIRALLQSSTNDWSTEDWQTYFDERAAHLEYEGGQSRRKAEAQAFECCITKWLNGHQQPSDPGRCAWCRKPEREGSAVVPFGVDGHGYTWLHPQCWDDWIANRCKLAEQTLAGFGVPAPQ